MAYNNFVFENTDGVAKIRPNDPDKRNALTFQIYSDLENIFLELARDDTVKVVRMEFLRDVGVKDIVKAWEEGLPKVCASPCSIEYKDFVAGFGDVKKGDIHQYTLTPEMVRVDRAGKVSDYKVKGLAKIVLLTWVGDHPPNPELKNGMLGR